MSYLTDKQKYYLLLALLASNLIILFTGFISHCSPSLQNLPSALNRNLERAVYDLDSVASITGL